MNRREMLQSMGGLALRAAAGRPNILVLLTDDQQHNTLGVGNPEVRTPHLDRLAREGTRFTHACIMGGDQGAVCVPSRAMLLTGRGLFHAPPSMLRPNTAPADSPPPLTFPAMFRKAGYATFGTGKWHNGPKSYATSFSHGDSIFFGGMTDQTKVPVASFDPTGEYPPSERRSRGIFSSELFTDSAIRFLREHKSPDPFLMYVAYTSPHDPRTAPPEYRAMYRPEKMTLPKNFLPEHPFDNGEMKVRDEQLEKWPRTEDAIRRHIAEYYAMITHVDSQIGRLLGALEESGRAADTIVIFAGDNGLALGQHGLMGKQNVYDHSVRVPLVMRGPGVPKGRTCESLCYLLDVFPTLCDLTGMPRPETVEGRSLVSAFRHPKAKIRDSVFFAYRHFQRAVRTERWKLILYNAGGHHTTQLFDVERDPWETRNLAGEASQAGRVRELTSLLKEWMKRESDPLDLDKADWGVG